MQILCNGIPKSGTHALMKAVELLGMPTKHGHIPYAERREGKQLLIKRHPRNVIISMVRFTGRELTQGNIITQMKTFDGAGVFDRFASYGGYLSDPDTHVVQFESLLDDDRELKSIAKFLGVDYLDDAFANIPGLTRTWTGKLSDWRDHWTDKVHQAWISEGGNEVELAWKY